MTTQTNTPQGQLVAIIKELRTKIHGLLLERDSFKASFVQSEARRAALQAKYDALADLTKK